jgi:RimJ/RimL family protein N-acetyltransferase
MTVPENENSIKLLQKLGFQFKEKMQDPSTKEDLNVYWTDLTTLRA